MCFGVVEKYLLYRVNNADWILDCVDYDWSIIMNFLLNLYVLGLVKL